MQGSVLNVNNLSIETEGKYLLKDVSFQVKKGESWAITGKSGSGKTLLGKAVSGLLNVRPGQVSSLIPSEQRAFIGQQHDFRSLIGQRSYYQQRFDCNYDKSIPTVRQILENQIARSGSSDYSSVGNLVELLQLTHLLNSKIIEISNGEGKRLQIALAIIKNAGLIVFDNPYTGLDVGSRKLLQQVIESLVQEGRVVIVTGNEVPACTSFVLELDEGKVKGILPGKAFLQKQKDEEIQGLETFESQVLSYSSESDSTDFATAIELRNVSVSYGEKVVLDNVSWKVEKGEKWALLGHNGAGKSTLLSLINGDNPQVYRNQVCLFDRKRGSGESIWEIKQKIGYISPELHLYFQRSTSYTEDLFYSSGSKGLYSSSGPFVSCFEAIASGFNDQVGSSGKITSFQKRKIEDWMTLLGINRLKKTNLYVCSLGEQRMVLLVRALVKNPPVLILDEPCQGLDSQQIARFNHIVDRIATHLNKTLIYVTHYKSEIPACVNKVLELEKGRVKKSP